MLSEQDALALRKSGFTHGEIMEFGEAVAPDGTPQMLNIRSATWQAAIGSRRRWVMQRRAQGWPQARIVFEINDWYRKKHIRSPWDFVKIEYKPPRRLTDYQDARQARIKQQVALVYGGWRTKDRGGKRR